MERVFSRQRTSLDRLCLPIERLVYRITAVNPDVEMTGKEYATCFVLFSLAGTLLLYVILRMQQFLPWFFPQYQTTPLSPDLALNTAISFSTTLPGSLRWREHDELFQPDGGTVRAKFPGWRCRVGGRSCLHRGLARQLSGTLGNFGLI